MYLLKIQIKKKKKKKRKEMERVTSIWNSECRSLMNGFVQIGFVTAIQEMDRSNSSTNSIFHIAAINYIFM